MEKVLDKGRSIENPKIHQDVRELTLAITLLAGLSAILIKFVGYFNNNIIDWNGTFFSVVYLLTVFVIIEILILFLFLLIKGYSLKAPRNIEGIVHKIADNLFRFAFIFPLLIIIYSLLGGFSYYYNERLFNFLPIFGKLILITLAITAYILIFYLLGFDVRKFYALLKSIDYKEFFRKTKEESPNERDRKILKLPSYALLLPLLYLVSLVVILVVMMGILLGPAFLFQGSYIMEIHQAYDSDSRILPVTIEDVGIPSDRCFVTLSRVNESDENLFQGVDSVIISELPENSSEFMSGKKRDGIYYLFINTTNLEPGYYLVHAEVTMLSFEDFFDFLESKKYDNKLFYLAPSSTGSE